jgi:hypothetical protein
LIKNDSDEDDTWYDEKTRAILTTFTLYDPSEDMWVACLILTEVSVAGNVHPTEIKSIVFKPNLFETDHDRSV